VDSKLARKDYTQTDLDNARTKGQILGWVQGGIGVIAGLLVLRFVGWIPTLVVLGVLGFLALKLLTGRKRE